ncbi:hypothetical protein [Fodinibius salsisoli]|uniref:Beta-lactamase-inhibitor-like, PepSY-like n=1 Tax=Fodinibius salsisoli TaxID=2820877 RepID=A0ABT3PQS3_9BACT|nr:hypothetical protein [Fodinibius salsisoli]MCW9708214.1 hypothetical protein [Fodinibius salsisoli]
MKTTKIIVSLSVLFLMALSLKAQDCRCPEEVVVEKTTVLTMIGENDYPNFLNISGLKKYSNIRYTGLAPGSAGAKTFTLKNTGKKFKLFATYREDGSLIKGIITSKDAPVPLTIRNYLAADDYKDWTMVHNKTVVRNFDAQRTEYEVDLERDGMKQRLFFDHSGNRIKKLSRA